MKLDLLDLVPGRVVLGDVVLLRSERTGEFSTSWAVRTPGGEASLTVFPAWLFGSPEQARAFAASLQRKVGLESRVLQKILSVRALHDGGVIELSAPVSEMTLRTWLEDGEDASIAEVCELGLTLLEGLEVLHSRDIVHGDLKPEHVHLSSVFGEVTLASCGVTSALWTSEHLGTRTQLVGTPWYAPLEQFSGEAPTPGSDLYNLAATLYEAWAHALPWKGRGFVEVFQSKMLPIQAPNGLERPGERALFTALARALAPRESDRYPSLADFRAALQASLRQA